MLNSRRREKTISCEENTMYRDLLGVRGMMHLGNSEKGSVAEA